MQNSHLPETANTPSNDPERSKASPPLDDAPYNSSCVIWCSGTPRLGYKEESPRTGDELASALHDSVQGGSSEVLHRHEPER